MPITTAIGTGNHGNHTIQRLRRASERLAAAAQTRGSGCDVANVFQNNANFHILYLHNKCVHG